MILINMCILFQDFLLIDKCKIRKNRGRDKWITDGLFKGWGVKKPRKVLTSFMDGPYIFSHHFDAFKMEIKWKYFCFVYLTTSKF